MMLFKRGLDLKNVHDAYLYMFYTLKLVTVTFIGVMVKIEFDLPLYLLLFLNSLSSFVCYSQTSNSVLHFVRSEMT